MLLTNGLDIHSETASRIFKVPLELVSAEMRRTAKIVNFGIMYGAGPFRMSQELGFTRNEANEVIKSYFKQFKGIRDYIDQVIDQARNMNYVKTLLGRRRPVFEVNSSNGLRRKAAERMAINMPIQGSAAEMIKIAMKNIIDELDKKKMQSKMVLQIHDELIFEFPENEESYLKKLVIDKMENVVELSVPLVVDYGIGNNWYEAH